MNKIKEYKGYGNYTAGVSKYSSTTSVYLFDIQETGQISEEGEMEYSYKLYEFLSSLPLQEARRLFIDDYMEYLSYTTETIIQIMGQGTSSTEYSGMIYAKVKSYKLADVIYKPSTLDYAKEVKTMEITAYDGSLDVNSFTLDGEQVWLDKSTRVGLMNSTQIEKAAGHETTTLWFGGKSYTIPCDMAIQMLSALELYALECYNTTAQHKANVMALQTKEEIEAYDYTTGYPKKLNLNTSAV